MTSDTNFYQSCHHDLVEVTKLIDLTDKPIQLTRDEIGWSKVRATASNCICCCCNNSITLVTTKDSYILDHIPLDNVQFAQTNPGLNYLAISNHRKLVIIELVDSGTLNQGASERNTDEGLNRHKSEVKIVNLSANGLSMSDVIHWRWLDNDTLALLTDDALFTCATHQAQINHPAYTALFERSRPLLLEKVCDVHPHLTRLCQVTDLQCDASKSLYSILGLYSTETIQNLTSGNNNQQTINQTRTENSSNAKLKPSFGSMPSRLSQLVHNEQLAETIKLDRSFDLRRMASHTSLHPNEDSVGGLVQVHCKMRNRSQLIQAHTAIFTQKVNLNDFAPDAGKTLLISANKMESRMRVNFVEMATPDNPIPSTSHNWSPLTSFDNIDGQDFPTAIVCSHLNQEVGKRLPVCMITTKYGQLYVFSINHGTKLFNTRITTEIISSAIIEADTSGLMVICRSGQVLLVKLEQGGINRLLDEKRRHVRSNLSSSINLASMGTSCESQSDNDKHIRYDLIVEPGALVRRQPSSIRSVESTSSLSNHGNKSSSLDAGLDVLISTKL